MTTPASEVRMVQVATGNFTTKAGQSYSVLGVGTDGSCTVTTPSARAGFHGR